MILFSDARKMGLGVSDDRLAEMITQDDAFKDASGSFSRAQLEAVLRSVGMPQDTYIESQRRNAVRQQIIEAASMNVSMPQAFVDEMAKIQGEKRTFELVNITPEAIADKPEPTEDQLTAWYDDHKNDYRAPEYRKLIVVKLEAEDITDEAGVTDDELKARYEKDKTRYTVPEKREVMQIVFQDKAAADAAAAKIEAGTSFDAVASEMNLNDQQLTSLQDAIRSGDSRLDSIGHYYGIENLSATLAPLLRGGENHGIKRESFEQAFPAIARFLGTGSPQLFDFYDHGGKLGIGGPFRDGARKLGGKRLTASDNANADKLNGENDNKRNTNNNNRGRCNGNRKMNNDRDADLEDIVAAQARMLLLAAGRGLPQRGRSFVDPSMVSAAGGNLAPLASSFLSNLERMDELGIEPSKKNELLILAATPVAISILMANSLGGRLANLDLGGFGREAAFQPFVA